MSGQLDREAGTCACCSAPLRLRAKASQPRAVSFTPGAWKLIAVALCLVNAVDNLAEAVDWWTWGKAGLSALAVVLLIVVGHRPSPRRLW